MIPRNIRGIALIALLVPDGVELAEETAGFVKSRVEVQLMQRRFIVLVEAAQGKGSVPRGEVRGSQAVTSAQGPLFADELVERDIKRFFSIIKCLRDLGDLAGSKRTSEFIRDLHLLAG